MANNLTMADITRIRTLAEAGWSLRKIARELDHDRATVRKYARAKPEPPPDADDSKPAISTTGSPPRSVGRPSACEPYRERIETLLEVGLSADRIWGKLKTEHGFDASYESVKRFVRKLKTTQPKRVWRLECNPGEEAQVDFGLARTLRRADGKLGYTNVLRVTLSFSRKAYTETVPYQNTECFIRALENAFRHFGGVPATLRIDNLKAAVRKADWYDPDLNPKILSFAEHYGTAVIPTRPYTPQHKGKVESDISYVKTSALKGREFTSIARQNQHLFDWETNTADKRIHGTTRKQVHAHFHQHEKTALRPLPLDLFPCYQEGRRTVHRDSYIEVAHAYYQVPPEYIGRRLWVRWDSKMLRVFDDAMAPVITHVRLEAGKFSHCLGARGIRKDTPHHTSHYWIERVALLGSSAEKWATALSRNRPDHCIRVMQGLLSLHGQDKHSAEAIDRACEAAWSVGDFTLGYLRRRLAELARGHQSARQDQLDLLDEHPLIRPLSHYQQILSPEELTPNP